MAKFDLSFTAHGTAQLFNKDDELIWSSDNDMNFKDEFTDEFLGEEDSDDVLDWLIEQHHLQPDDEIDVYEDALEEYDEDDSDGEDEDEP